MCLHKFQLYSELKNKYASQLAVDRELKSQSIEFRKVSLLNVYPST